MSTSFSPPSSLQWTSTSASVTHRLGPSRWQLVPSATHDEKLCNVASPTHQQPFSRPKSLNFTVESDYCPFSVIVKRVVGLNSERPPPLEVYGQRRLVTYCQRRQDFYYGLSQLQGLS